MRDILLAEGVPLDMIHLEGTSGNTAENIAMALPILSALDEREVLLVSDWYHLPRARLVAARNGLQARGSGPSLRGARPWPQIKGALREVPALIAYAFGFRA